MSEEVSESEVIRLLGAYGDALERHASKGSDRPADELNDNQQPADAGTKGENKMEDNMADKETVEESSETPEVGIGEVGIVPDQPAQSSNRGRVLVGAFVAALVVVNGGIFAINANSTEVDTTEVAQDVEEEDGAADATAEASDGSASGEAVVDESAEASDSADVVEGSSQPAGFGFGGPGSVLFVDGEFVSLGDGPDGLVLSRSADGVNDWSSESVTGLPEDGYPQGLVQTVDGFAAIVEIFPEFDEEDESFLFGPGPEAERLLATSTDLLNWTTTEFPEVDLPEDGFSFVNGLAASGDQLAILVQIETGGNDELQILFEQGIVGEEDLNNYCGLDFEGDTIIGLSCDFDEVDAIDADAVGDEVDAVEDVVDFGEPTELFRLEPGDPGFNEVEASFEAKIDFEPVPPVVVTGPIDGPFETVELPASGFASSIVGGEGGFLTAFSSFNNGTASVLSSPDGLTWTESDGFDTDASIDTIAISNGLAVAVGSSFSSDGGVVAFVSDDFGVTWTESDLPSELFGAFGQPLGGPAGFAVQLDGSLEPFDDFNPFGDTDEVELTRDGFTMVLFLNSGDASLIGPDGVLIHEIDEQVFLNGGAENVARFEGRFDEDLIWLDPETGEDLVTFSQSDFDEAFEDLVPDFDDSGFVEPDRGSEVWFSADGVTWTLLQSGGSNFDEDSFTTVAAVGDDEVLLLTETFTDFGEPPAELLAFEEEGREPTDEEIAALDEWFEQQNIDAGGSSVWESIPVG